MQSLHKHHGFTIVELLIVIVVIAILAAISVVAYNGIQNRAGTAAGQTLASQVAKKAQAWHSVEGTYPTFAQLMTNKTDAAGTGVGATVGTNYQGATAGPAEARLDNPASVSQSPPAAGTGRTQVQYVPCGSPQTGARIHFFNFSASPQAATTPATNPASITIGTC